VEETPSLNELQRRIVSRGGLVLGISEDDDPQAYEEFLKTYRIQFPTFRDTTKQIPAQYGTSMYPDTYVIARNGKLDRKIVGPQDWTSPEMSAYVDSLLDAK
jgi:cytochrome c biogenesis protein CcmG/thiol:disulfide interchange protein DsbE